jgi:voltage-dependent potassium channel beta subunit
MQYRRLGTAGLKVSAVSLGAWTTYGGSLKDLALITDIVKTAHEGGINFFDNADAYARGEGERTMARVIDNLGIPRHHLVLSSKVFWPMSDVITDRGLSRKHVLESIDRSLERMETDYLDIYFAHRYDPETPMEEIVEAFSDVVRSGRALYWGTSEWSGAQIAEAHTLAKASGLVAPVVEQPQYSLLYRERVEGEILPVTSGKGIGLVVWSPLAMGVLTGKYDQGMPAGARLTENETFRARLLTDANIAKVQGLKGIADDLGITRSQLALAWALRQPGVSSVITGATAVAQIQETLKAAEVVLDDATSVAIDAVMAG